MARDLRSALDQVGAAQAEAEVRQSAPTVPDAASGAATAFPREEALELRPSPRFDSTAGIARLSVLPAQPDDTSSRAGWTVQMKRQPRKVDAAKAAVVLALALATIGAIAMIVI